MNLTEFIFLFLRFRGFNNCLWGCLGKFKNAVKFSEMKADIIIVRRQEKNKKF